MIYAKTCHRCKCETHSVMLITTKWGYAAWQCENRIDCHLRAKQCAA